MTLRLQATIARWKQDILEVQGHPQFSERYKEKQTFTLLKCISNAEEEIQSLEDVLD